MAGLGDTKSASRAVVLGIRDQVIRRRLNRGPILIVGKVSRDRIGVLERTRREDMRLFMGHRGLPEGESRLSVHFVHAVVGGDPLKILVGTGPSKIPDPSAVDNRSKG